MWLIVLEAALALGLLIFIVWWTMFHGRSTPDATKDKRRRGDDDRA